jgi:hypothetical protein
VFSANRKHKVLRAREGLAFGDHTAGRHFVDMFRK